MSLTLPPTVAIEPNLDPAEFLDVLARSGLGDRRPVDEPERIEEMVRIANLVAAARDLEAGGTLIGVARCVTDFAYCCYCSDLAVDRDYQRGGLGKQLIAACRAALHPKAKFILISAPGAVGYYEHLGMTRMDTAFVQAGSAPEGW